MLFQRSVDVYNKYTFIAIYVYSDKLRTKMENNILRVSVVFEFLLLVIG